MGNGRKRSGGRISNGEKGGLARRGRGRKKQTREIFAKTIARSRWESDAAVYLVDSLTETLKCSLITWHENENMSFNNR